MPKVTTEADGSQDALLVRVVVGGHVGWDPEPSGERPGEQYENFEPSTTVWFPAEPPPNGHPESVMTG
jgi:hypothetical protein